MQGPFNALSRKGLVVLFWCLTILFVATTGWLVHLDAMLAGPAAPNGIVSFELAGDLETAQAILDGWSGETTQVAILLQGVDFLYLFLYPLLLSLVAQQLARTLGGRWFKIGILVSWLILIAVPLDAVENHALIEQLFNGASDFYAALAWWCAVPKFIILGVAIAYTVTASVAWAWRRATGAAHRAG